MELVMGLIPDDQHLFSQSTIQFSQNRGSTWTRTKLFLGHLIYSQIR